MRSIDFYRTGKTEMHPVRLFSKVEGPLDTPVGPTPRKYHYLKRETGQD